MDKPPNCNRQCDVCVDKNRVAENVSAFRAIALQTRIGNVESAEGYWDDDSEAVSEDQLEGEERAARKQLIEEEFRRRRGNAEQISLKSAWCAAPKNTHLLYPDCRTVTGITGKTRDQTLQLLFDALKARFPDQETDLWSKCSAVEYNLYKESKVAAMYRTRMARLITRIRRVDVTPEEVWSIIQSSLPVDSHSISYQTHSPKPEVTLVTESVSDSSSCKVSLVYSKTLADIFLFVKLERNYCSTLYECVMKNNFYLSWQT
ncbi:unnamed protein product [Echinostoma caproni]|uniref:RecQ_Zn_bind domain-containing protein n=1 Tax=Echinostoma caproni TaxID=27848 RepID=A0A183B6P7_9TREM|nr:unnamed protein product [Echinostoma caproni]